MRNERIAIVLLFIFGVIAGCSSHAQTPQTFLFDSAVLEQNKIKTEEGDEQLNAALDALITKADGMLQQQPRSVVEKATLPPSGDKHDYISLAGNYWPDPSKPDGLPYIRIDGKNNPESRKAQDRVYLRELGMEAETLGLAYYYTQDEKYAEHLAKLLEVWFLDDETKMNPNLRYANAKPGIQDGGPAGVNHARHLVNIIDGVQLIANSPAWTSQNQMALKEWFGDYLDWLLHSDMGKKASQLKNNIGTAYDMQVLIYALFSDNKPVAEEYLKNNIPQRMEMQFTREGEQPLELDRADAWAYSNANLKYWFNIAQVAEIIGTDLWNYETSSGKSIKKTFDWMKPYSQKKENWTYGQENKQNSLSSASFDILQRRAVKKYGGQNNALARQADQPVAAAEKKPSLKDRTVVISILTSPVQ